MIVFKVLSSWQCKFFKFFFKFNMILMIYLFFHCESILKLKWRTNDIINIPHTNNEHIRIKRLWYPSWSYWLVTLYNPNCIICHIFSFETLHLEHDTEVWMHLWTCHYSCNVFKLLSHHWISYSWIGYVWYPWVWFISSI